MGTKRKLDVDVAAPSPRRTTRASSRLQISQDLQPVDAVHRRQSSRHCAKGIRGEGNSENDIKGKGKVGEGDQPKKRTEPDVRKKGSANKLITINNSLDEHQKEAIRRVGFGGLLEVKCTSVLEKLSSWLIKIFDIENSELIIPYKGRIKVDDQAIQKVFGLPIGAEHIDYEKKSGAETFIEFYKIFGHEKDQIVPTFVEAEKWFSTEGKGQITDKFLQYWLVFAISTFLCPTSSTKLCVKAFHSVVHPGSIASYNWCHLVIKRLKKGITKVKLGEQKYVSGCLFFLTICFIS